MHFMHAVGFFNGLVYRGGAVSMTGGAFGATSMTVGSCWSGCTSTTGIPSCREPEKFEVEDTLTYPLTD